MPERICKAEAVRRYGRRKGIDPVSGHLLEKAADRGYLRTFTEGVGGRRRVYFYAEDIEEWMHRYDRQYTQDFIPWIPSWWSQTKAQAQADRFGIPFQRKDGTLIHPQWGEFAPGGRFGPPSLPDYI